MHRQRSIRMGRVVTFAQLPMNKSEGVGRAPITGGDTREMAAEFIRIEPGRGWAETVPSGSDCYLFVLDGNGAIDVAGKRHRLSAQSFATLQEGTPFRLDGASALDIVKVIAPPRPGSRGLAGFDQTIAIAERAATPVVEIPA